MRRNADWRVRAVSLVAMVALAGLAALTPAPA